MEAQAVAGIRSRCDRLLARVTSMAPALPLADRDAVESIRTQLGAPPDLVVQEVSPAARLLFLTTLIDKPRLDSLIEQIQGGALPAVKAGTTPGHLAAECEPVDTSSQVVEALLSAKAVLVSPGGRCGVAVPLAAWPKRQTAEPKAELVTQGPHDGFTEDMQTNVALLRHRIPEPSFRWERLHVGRRSRVDGAMLYLDGVVRPDLLARTRRQLRRSRPSFVTDSSMLGQWMAFNSGFLFPTVGKSERPDIATAALLSGRIVVFVEGSPVALMVPNTFADLVHSPEDYYNRPYSAFFRRVMRLVGMLVSLVASPLFVALVTVNRELVPVQIFISIAQARAGVPFGALPEIVIMEIMVEVIREAGLHLPGALGQTISIVGAVVIGQSAVIAGLISAPSIVVVSVGFICSFIIPSPDASLALRILRYPLILLAAAFGIFGIAWGLAILLAYLCALQSFGVAYLSPVTPARPRGMQDAIWRRPLPGLRRSFVARTRGNAR